MKRRDFIALLGGGAVTPLLAAAPARAQRRSAKIPRIGIIDDGPMWNAFREAMRASGYVDGSTIAYNYRIAEGRTDRLTAATAELARLPVDVIVTFGTPPTLAAKAATSTIPIVMISVGDPMAAGLVRSLARPGGNITGNTILAPDLSPKRLQLVKEIVPTAARVALLWNPDNVSNHVILEQMRAAAPDLDLAFTAVEARSADDLPRAFATMARERIAAVLLTSDPLHQGNIQKIISLLFHHGLPGMFQTRDHVADGGLMSYGASFPDLFRSGAGYVVKILRGAKPADLPVLPPERFELVINLKTARTLGIKISDAVLLRADEVIE